MTPQNIMTSPRILSSSDTGVFRGPNGNITGRVDYNPQLSPVVNFRIATAREVQNALRDELYHGDNVTLSLAKQGLYEEENQGTVLHPKNKNWIGYSFGMEERGEIGSYTLSREVYDSILEVFGERPELICEKSEKDQSLYI